MSLTMYDFTTNQAFRHRPSSSNVFISPTISKDNTQGENARQSDLLANFGKKLQRQAFHVPTEKEVNKQERPVPVNKSNHLVTGLLGKDDLDYPLQAKVRSMLDERTDPATQFYQPSQSNSAPVLGRLPTPKLTPQNTGSSFPATTTGFRDPHSSPMDLQTPDATCIPDQQTTTHRSSSTHSIPISRISSPESMVSDISSRSSRPSISSHSNKPNPRELDVQTRCRYAGEKNTIADLHEGFHQNTEGYSRLCCEKTSSPRRVSITPRAGMWSGVL